MTKAIIVYSVMAAIGLFAPIIGVTIWKKKTKESIKPILVGAVIFFVFAIILESFPKLIFFQTNNPIGKFVMGNVWIYMPIAAALAGIFEETGRLVAFKFMLKKETNRKTAITYGIGHGGFEVMYLMVVGGIQYVVYCVLIETGQFDQIISQVVASAPEQIEAVSAIPETLAATTFAILGYSVLERCSAVLIHISCSIIMFTAVRCKGKMWLYPIAMLLHASIDMIAAFYQAGMIKNLLILELGMIAWALLFFFICYNLIYKKLPRYADEM